MIHPYPIVENHEADATEIDKSWNPSGLAQRPCTSSSHRHLTCVVVPQTRFTNSAPNYSDGVLSQKAFLQVRKTRRQASRRRKKDSPADCGWQERLPFCLFFCWENLVIRSLQEAGETEKCGEEHGCWWTSGCLSQACSHHSLNVDEWVGEPKVFMSLNYIFQSFLLELPHGINFIRRKLI